MAPNPSRGMAFVYFLRLRSGNIYVGCTVDLEQRLRDHHGGVACHTTRQDPPVKLPPRQWDLQRQYKRNPARCQPITVWGWMITNVFSQPDQTARRQTHSSRSGLRNLGFPAVRCNTRSWCRRAMLSSSSCRCDWKAAPRLRSTARITPNIIRAAWPNSPTDQRIRFAMRFSLTTEVAFQVSVIRIVFA
jgi:hypothetical protein